MDLYTLPTPYPDETWYSIVSRYHLSSTSKHEGEMKPQRGRSRLYILVKGKYPITPVKPRIRPFCSGGGVFPRKPNWPS